MGVFSDWYKKLRGRGFAANPADGLETEKEYSERWVSIRIIYFTMFLMSLGFSIVLTGVWPYLNKLDPKAGKEFMGLIVGANPLAQMVMSPLVGWWANRSGSIRAPLLVTLVLFTLASALYSALESLPEILGPVRYWMFFSRFLVGVSSGNIAACRSYLSAATRIRERTPAVSMVSLAQVLGFIVGPGLQAAVTPLGENGVMIWGLGLRLDMYTAAGWVNVFLGILNFVFFLPWIFSERRIAAREVMHSRGLSSEEESWKTFKPDLFTAWTLIVAFSVLVFNFVLLETLGSPLTMDQFAWSTEDALYYMGLLMSGGAVIACVTFVGIGPLCKKFDELRVLIWGGFFLMVLGRVLYIPFGSEPPLLAEAGVNNSLGCPVDTQKWCATVPAMSVWQFVVGYILTAVGYPIGVTLIQTVYSKVLGARPQGVWMGILTGAGCLSRVLGPVFVTGVYTLFGTIWTFGITTAVMALSQAWLMFFQKRLSDAEKASRGHAAPEDLPLEVEVPLTVVDVDGETNEEDYKNGTLQPNANAR